MQEHLDQIILLPPLQPLFLQFVHRACSAPSQVKNLKNLLLLSFMQLVIAQASNLPESLC